MSAADGRLAKAVSGRVILITGASSGIGRSTALRCGRAGATVVLMARRRELLEQVCEEIATIGDDASIQPVDLSDQAAIEGAMGDVIDRHGTVECSSTTPGTRSAARSSTRWTGPTTPSG
ncbi:MAG: hypothetical protein DLM63_01530 [Solirubrobacterales bacterium]|nr:MAG: hypothetical protein DLM63_01530 [Solirubrobacterales bacterium]